MAKYFYEIHLKIRRLSRNNVKKHTFIQKKCLKRLANMKKSVPLQRFNKAIDCLTQKIRLKMKKLVFMFVAMAAVSFASCGSTSSEATSADTLTADSVVVEDTLANDSVADSLATDSVVADSVAA